MATNLEISGSIRRTEEGNELWWYGGGGIGWESTLAACAGVPVGVRSGRTVGVIEDSKVVEYVWHPEDTSDDGLALKTVQQTALDAKANLSGADFTGAISVITPTADAHAVNKGYADGTYAPIDSVHYRGTYATLAALQAAIPVGNPGDEALVDAGVGTDALKYIWDDSDQDWVQGGGTGASSFADLSGQPGDNAALASALNGKEATANKSLSVNTDQASDVKYPSVKAVYDWAVGLFQTLANKDATGGYAGLTLFKINFKNAANTFTSFFTNVNTAARTYTFQDKDGTIAGLDDTTLSATASGTDTYTATISPAITAYVINTKYAIKFTNANTGASTINLNSLGAKSIVKSGTTALVSGDIVSEEIKFLVYDGTNFQIVGGSGGTSLTKATDAEMQTGTEDTHYATPAKTTTWWTWIKTQAITWANKHIFNVGSETGSSSGTGVVLNQTWNTTGRPIALKISVTDTQNGNPAGNGVDDSAALISARFSGNGSFFTLGKGTNGNIFAFLCGPVGSGHGPGYFAALPNDLGSRAILEVNTDSQGELSFGRGYDSERDWRLFRVADNDARINGRLGIGINPEGSANIKLQIAGAFSFGDASGNLLGRSTYTASNGDPAFASYSGKGFMFYVDNATVEALYLTSTGKVQLKATPASSISGYKLLTRNNSSGEIEQISALQTAPASATATGATGEIRITSGYIYVCIATNTWVRSALSTW